MKQQKSERVRHQQRFKWRVKPGCFQILLCELLIYFSQTRDDYGKTIQDCLDFYLDFEQSVFHHEFTRHLNLSQFVKRETLEFIRYTLLFLCLMRKIDLLPWHFVSLFCFSYQTKLLIYCYYTPQMKLLGPIRLSPLAVQSGITRRDGPQLAGWHAEIPP